MTPITELFYPDALELFKKKAGKKSVTAYYHSLIFSDKKSEQAKALSEYGAYEYQVGNEMVSFNPIADVPAAGVLKFRIYMHYEKRGFFLKENQILNDAHKIKHIPCTIFHNRLDMNCPVVQAWKLHQALPKSKLFIIPDGGHGGQMMYDAMLAESKKA